MCFKKKNIGRGRAFVMFKCPQCGCKYDIMTTKFNIFTHRPIIKDNICPQCGYPKNSNNNK